MGKGNGQRRQNWLVSPNVLGISNDDSNHHFRIRLKEFLKNYHTNNNRKKDLSSAKNKAIKKK